VVTFRTALAGPSFKGRAYMGGFDEDQNDGNANTAAAVKTAVESFWNTLRQNLTTIGYEQSILSPALPLRPSSVPGKPDLPAKSSTNERVTSCEVRNLLWGSQRRRTHRT